MDNILIPITKDESLFGNRAKFDKLLDTIENSNVCPYLDHKTRTLADMLMMVRVLQHLQGTLLDEIADSQYTR